MSGICGSDTKQMFLHGAVDNPLTAILSFPHVLGHEVVAPPRGLRPAGRAQSLALVRPARHRSAMRRVRRRPYPWCRNFNRGVPPASLHLGNCAGARRHPRAVHAHECQLFTVPDAMSDDAAVLADPASVSLRTILLTRRTRRRPRSFTAAERSASRRSACSATLHPDVEVGSSAGPAIGPSSQANIRRALGT